MEEKNKKNKIIIIVVVVFVLLLVIILLNGNGSGNRQSSRSRGNFPGTPDYEIISPLPRHSHTHRRVITTQGFNSSPQMPPNMGNQNFEYQHSNNSRANSSRQSQTSMTSGPGENRNDR
ncbi:hypothetical protein CDIK_0218 [Cucumispora dikerogammari]|nr:hypothetical protein CDIK_0218 [Cucumispora dikerogammari]